MGLGKILRFGLLCLATSAFASTLTACQKPEHPIIVQNQLPYAVQVRFALFLPDRDEAVSLPLYYFAAGVKNSPNRDGKTIEAGESVTLQLSSSTSTPGYIVVVFKTNDEEIVRRRFRRSEIERRDWRLKVSESRIS